MPPLTIKPRPITTRKDAERYRQSVAEEVAKDIPVRKELDRFVLQEQLRKNKRGAPVQPLKDKVRLATFSLTEEDIRFVEKATYQVSQALEKSVNKSHAIRLVVRAVARMEVAEVQELLARSSARALRTPITPKR